MQEEQSFLTLSKIVGPLNIGFTKDQFQRLFLTIKQYNPELIQSLEHQQEVIAFMALESQKLNVQPGNISRFIHTMEYVIFKLNPEKIKKAIQHVTAFTSNWHTPLENYLIRKFEHLKVLIQKFEYFEELTNFILYSTKIKDKDHRKALLKMCWKLSILYKCRENINIYSTEDNEEFEGILFTTISIILELLNVSKPNSFLENLFKEIFYPNAPIPETKFTQWLQKHKNKIWSLIKAQLTQEAINLFEYKVCRIFQATIQTVIYKDYELIPYDQPDEIVILRLLKCEEPNLEKLKNIISSFCSPMLISKEIVVPTIDEKINFEDEDEDEFKSQSFHNPAYPDHFSKENDTKPGKQAMQMKEEQGEKVEKEKEKEKGSSSSEQNDEPKNEDN